MSTPAVAKPDSASPAQPASNYWTWHPPSAPIRVNLAYSVISRLQEELHHDPQDEAGGILLGNAGRTPGIVEINDYVHVSSETASDGQYRLNISTLDRLRNTNTGSDRVIGYFRTQSHGSLEPREEDIDLVRKHFPEASDIVLLIRTSPEKDTAAFFFWYGDFFTPFSLQDFPFNVASLRGDFVAPPKPAVEMKTTKAAVAALFEPVIEPGIEPIGETIPEPIPQPIKEIWIPEPVEQEKRAPRRLLPIFAVLLLVLAGASGWVFKDYWMTALKRQNHPVPVVSEPLRLGVEAQGNGLDIRWNPQSATVVHGVAGHLLITPLNQPPQTVDLRPEQLAGGHVFFQSPGEQVEFRLRVVDGSGHAVEESVLALSTKLAPPVVETPAQPAPAAPAPVKEARVESPRIVKVTEVPRKGPAPRPFTPPQPTQGSAQPTRSILLDPPAPVRAANLPEALLGVNGRVLPPVTAPKPAPTVPTVVAAPPLQVPQPPIPTKKVSPRLDVSVARMLPANRPLQISITLRIDATGRIIRAEKPQYSIAVPPRLIQAAIDAAMQWEFKPARLGDKAVPSEYNVRFDFQK